MAMKFRKGGIWQTIVGWPVFAGGSWRTITNAKIFEGGAWRDFANFVTLVPMTAKASPTSVAGASAFTVVTTNPTTVTPSGGKAPYSYAWAVTTFPHSSTALAPTSATTAFRCSGLASGDEASGSATCTVTDSLGTTATATVGLSFSRA